MKLTIDWSQVPSEFKWAAMDASGAVWVYTKKPEKMTYGFTPQDKGLAEFLYIATSDWHDSLTERPEEPKVKQPEQPTATKHPHADFLAEALKDVLRQIQVKRAVCTDVDFRDVTLQEAIDYNENFVFRFADTVKPEVTSPLTDDELCEVWNKSNITAKNVVGYLHQLRTIAIAAKIATLKEVAAMPSECCTDGVIAQMYASVSEQPLRPQDTRIVTEFARYVWLQSASNFQAQLLKQLGE